MKIILDIDNRGDLVDTRGIIIYKGFSSQIYSYDEFNATINTNELVARLAEAGYSAYDILHLKGKGLV